MGKSSDNKDFSGRIATRVLIWPLIFIFIVLVCAGGAFYIMPEFSHIRTPEAAYIAAVSAEKKSSIDSWFSERTSDLEIISNHPLIKFNTLHLGVEDASKKGAAARRRVLSRSARSEMQESISSLLKERSVLGYRAISLIHNDGTVIASTDAEIIGSEWSSLRFVTQDIKSLKDPLVRLTGSSVDRSVEMIVPVADADGNVNGLLFGQIDTTRLLALIKAEKPQFRSLSVSLTDQSGRVVFGLPDFGSASSEKDAPESGRFYTTISKLQHAPLNIFVKVSRSETSSAMRLITICYLSILVLLGMIIIFILYRFNNLVSLPLRDLASSIRAYRNGDAFIAGDIKCRGELSSIKNEIYELIELVTEQQNKQDDRLKAKRAAQDSKELLEQVSSVLKNSSSQMKKKSDALMLNYQDQNAGRSAIKFISNMSDQLESFSGSLRSMAKTIVEPQNLTPERFDLSSFFNDLSREAESITTAKQLTFVSDLISCEDGSQICADANLIKKMVLSLIKNSVANTDAGTVSLLVSRASSAEAGSAALEIVVADTGKGLDDEAAEIFEQGGFNDINNIELALARAAALQLSGRLIVENLKNKGLVVTAVISLDSA
ncbi:MAG: sensor histidine kinase [Nitrospirae bacterium]|nr:sensor histidine kinase [Nitrospirota bacterium]